MSLLWLEEEQLKHTRYWMYVVVMDFWCLLSLLGGIPYCNIYCKIVGVRVCVTWWTELFAGVCLWNLMDRTFFMMYCHMKSILIFNFNVKHNHILHDMNEIDTIWSAACRAQLKVGNLSMDMDDVIEKVFSLVFCAFGNFMFIWTGWTNKQTLLNTLACFGLKKKMHF